jgi:phosphatidylserine/phosphatidylglycerophosphate/cardiolipin synthase-like enzyme
MRRKRHRRSLFRLPINMKTLSLSSLCLIIGLILGGYLFDKPSFPIYEPVDGTQIQTCFTPRQQCLPSILSQIENARKEILVQAYSFTSKPIAEALVRVAQRGLTIKVIVDKSQETAKHAQIKLLTDAGIDVKVDDKVSIAHNKVILIDGHTLLTGSYNFTEGAISSLFTIRPSPKNTEIIG